MLVKILDKCNIFNAIDIQIVQERTFPTLALIFVSFRFFFVFETKSIKVVLSFQNAF